MKIIEPNVELIENKDSVAHVARCARVCYGKETGNDELTVANLMKNKHYSMFRHDTKYYIIPVYNASLISDYLKYLVVEHGNKVCGVDIKVGNGKYYLVTNDNYEIEHPMIFFHRYKVTPEEFANTKIGYSMMRYTFLITTQISTSRELNRVSPNNIAEQSTRYVLEDGVICRPHWLNKDDVVDFNTDNNFVSNYKAYIYLNNCKANFENYKELIEYGVKKQDARGILPLDTATKVIYTYSVDEWKHIIDLRADKRAHPNCIIIANLIKKQLEELGYNI